jgi:phosphatidylglycerol:prolipoprotein diacylglycerol transferase
MRVSLHALAVVLGVVAAAALVRRRTRDPDVALGILAAATVAALAGAHVHFRALHGGPGGLWTGGLSSTGGIAAALATIWVAARATDRPPLALLDALAPAGLLALGIGRIGCFLAGCCYGVATDLPWGVVFPDLGPPARHPLQLYAAAGDLGLVFLLPGRDAPAGRVTRAVAIGFGVLRAGLETLRDPAAADLVAGGPLTLAQAAALLLAAAGWLGPAFARRLRGPGPSTIAAPRRSTSP